MLRYCPECHYPIDSNGKCKGQLFSGTNMEYCEYDPLKSDKKPLQLLQVIKGRIERKEQLIAEHEQQILVIKEEIKRLKSKQGDAAKMYEL